MKNRPNGIRFDEVVTVLKHHGYELVRQSGSSHAQFRNAKGDVITIKKENPLKAVYVKDVLERIGE
jgi:predicted RNA binding protein YcfA (HicA-like mRNA interferase family)